MEIFSRGETLRSVNDGIMRGVCAIAGRGERRHDETASGRCGFYAAEILSRKNNRNVVFIKKKKNYIVSLLLQNEYETDSWVVVSVKLKSAIFNNIM